MNDPTAPLTRPRQPFAPIPLVLKETELGCLIPISHKLQKNGYFRRRVRREGRSVRDYGHRIAFMDFHGLTVIPEGVEIDHVCRQRACCNARHMQAIPRREHQYLTSKMRDAELNEDARLLWEVHGRTMTGKALSEAISISQTAASRWIKGWRDEIAADDARWAA